jgi:hypothetical protein
LSFHSRVAADGTARLADLDPEPGRRGGWSDFA